MTLKEFIRFMLTKSSSRSETPADEMMVERVYSALKKIADETTPIQYMLTSDEINSGDYQIYRKLEDGAAIRWPKKPKMNGNKHVDIEDRLQDALAYLVLAGLELPRAKTLMGLFKREIDNYNNFLIEEHLEEATNDARRHNEFP